MLRTEDELKNRGRTDGQGRTEGQAVADPVEAYLRAVAQAVEGLSREDIWTAVDMFIDTARRKGRIYVIGNGGSAATASHMAVDLNKQAMVPGAPLFRAIALTDNMPLLTAWANDEHYDMVFYRQLANHLEPGDLLVAISTSGNSRNVLRAVELAQEIGAQTVGLTGCDGGTMRKLVDHCVFVPCEEIGQQESVHLLVDHVITAAIRARLDGAS